MAPKVSTVLTRTANAVQNVIHPFGASIGCMHYAGASFVSPLNNQLQQRINALLGVPGYSHPFTSDPLRSRWANLSEFYLQGMTPKEVRFGTNRKMISNGDGATEAPRPASSARWPPPLPTATPHCATG